MKKYKNRARIAASNFKSKASSVTSNFRKKLPRKPTFKKPKGNPLKWIYLGIAGVAGYVVLKIVKHFMNLWENSKNKGSAEQESRNRDEKETVLDGLTYENKTISEGDALVIKTKLMDAFNYFWGTAETDMLNALKIDKSTGVSEYNDDDLSFIYKMYAIEPYSTTNNGSPTWVDSLTINSWVVDLDLGGWFRREISGSYMTAVRSAFKNVIDI